MTNNSTSYTFENLETEVDMNSLFTLNYNFDLLKSLIVTLIQNQKSTNQKLLDIEEKIKEKDQTIEQLHAEVIKIKEKEESDEIIEDEKSIEKIDDKLDSKRSSDISENAPLNLTKDPNKKVNFIDLQVKNLFGVNTELSDIKRKLREHDDSLEEHQNTIDKINKVLEELKSKQKEFESNFQEINFKLVNVDALNLFRKDDGDRSSFGNEELATMVLSLEKKFNLKISYIEERFKKNEEDFLKIRQLEKSIDQNYQDLLLTNKNLEWVKEQISIIFASIEDIKVFTKSLNDTTNNNFKQEDQKIRDYLDLKLNEFTNIISNIHDNPSKDLGSNGHSQTTDDSKIKDIQRRLAELEKNFKSFSTSINIDLINKELLKLTENINSKASKIETFDLKESISELTMLVNILRDSVTQLQEDRKILDDINWLRKKVESLSSSYLNLKNNDEFSVNVSSNKININDHSRYVELTTFNDFKKDSMKEFDNINMAIKEIKSLLEEILANLKLKLTEKELRAVEEYLLVKIEELKTGCQKKFADKNETAKNLKYLDGQIKHIIELYIKKMEKGDNWLIAKKPIGGYSCASCEAYIGDLHENMQYIAWNKYPMRDPNDKNYRVGNGFSKMLQMINVEPGRPKNTQTSYEFFKNQEQQEKKELNLPRVKSNHNRETNVNMSADDIINPNLNENQDELQPSIVKIYKKSKEKKND